MGDFFRSFDNLWGMSSGRNNVRDFWLTPIIRNYIAFSFAIGAALSAGVVHGMQEADIYYRYEPVTRAEYERIRLDMSIPAIEAILGRGTEVAQTRSTIAFEWENPDGSSITVLFENGYLTQKAQSGL